MLLMNILFLLRCHSFQDHYTYFPRALLRLSGDISPENEAFSLLCRRSIWIDVKERYGICCEEESHAHPAKVDRTARRVTARINPTIHGGASGEFSKLLVRWTLGRFAEV